MYCVSSTIEIDVELFVIICVILYDTFSMNDFADIFPYPFSFDKPYLLACCDVLSTEFEKEFLKWFYYTFCYILEIKESSKELLVV